MFDQHTSDMVWRGDERAVRIIAKRYQDGTASLVEYATALYSMRSYSDCAEDLIALASRLVAYARTPCRKYSTCTSTEARMYADEADVLSCHLRWLSRQRVKAFKSEQLHGIALSLCMKGIAITKLFPNEFVGHHTPALLRLTSAQLALDTEEWTYARKCVREATETASQIIDLRQRARVFRKAGALCRNNGLHIRGIWLGLRALLVRNVPLDVHIKSMVALLAPSLAM